MFGAALMVAVGCGGGAGAPADGAAGTGGKGAAGTTGAAGTSTDAATDQFVGNVDAAAGADGGQDASTETAPPDGPTANVAFVPSTLTAGEYHSCALTAAGAVHCWGQNLLAQLGNATAGSGSGAPVASAGGMTFGALAAGQQHTCGLTAAGKAYCWGTGPELGGGTPGSTGTTAIPTAVSGNLVFSQLTAGRRYTCGVTANGGGYCWGANASGELGNDVSPAFPATTPTAVLGGLTFKSIHGGNSDHTCGVTTDGTAWCWGANSSGQLGADMMGGTVRMPIAVKTTVKFTAVMTGDLHSCGLGTDAKIYCWGDDGAGQLGNAKAAIDEPVPAAIATTETFKAVAVGLNFTCGLTTAGTAMCWGDTFNGQVGRGISGTRPGVTERATPTAVMGGLTFASIAAGYNHACGITPQGTAYCWGFNARGEVGDGTVNMVRNVPTAVTGGLTFAPM